MKTQNDTKYGIKVWTAEEKSFHGNKTKKEAIAFVKKIWNDNDKTYEVFHLETMGKNEGEYVPTNMRSFFDETL